MKLDAKTIAATAALITAIGGGVELRMQVGLLSTKVDRIEAELRRPYVLAGRYDEQDDQAGEKAVSARGHAR